MSERDNFDETYLNPNEFPARNYRKNQERSAEIREEKCTGTALPAALSGSDGML